MGTNEGKDWNTLSGISEDELNLLSQPFQDGTWSGELGQVWPERPRLHPGYPASLRLHLPQGLMSEIDSRAASDGLTRSEMIRRILSRGQD